MMELLAVIIVSLLWHVAIVLNDIQEVITWKPQRSIFYRWRWFIENRWKMKYTDASFSKVKWQYKFFPFLLDGWHATKYIKYGVILTALTLPFYMGASSVDVVTIWIASGINSVAPYWVHKLFFHKLLIRKLYRGV